MKLIKANYSVFYAKIFLNVKNFPKKLKKIKLFINN